MSKLESARKSINQIDTEMARLFEARMQAAAEIAAYKKDNGLSIRDPAREEELIERNRSLIGTPELVPYYVQFLKNTMEVSCEYQARLMREMRVAYCGTEGAFACIAARRMFPEARTVAFPTFADAYAAVERGEYDCAVLPMENSYAGEVGSVMDLMFSGSLSINQVLDVPIVHDLLACPGATKETVRTVLSHPQALQQCDAYLRTQGYETQTYSNTALAAEYVRTQNDPTLAAIASEETAERLGLKVLDAAINDSHSNTTRFAAFSRVPHTPLTSGRREDENFLLVFTVQNESGALAGALNIIGAHGFNLRSLRSRPMKDLQWSYYFYVEAEGNINTPNGKEMLQELSALCAKLRLVGSYYADNVK